MAKQRAMLSTISLCPICGIEGEIRPKEWLPKGGVLMTCFHKDGQEHEWGEYGSIEEVKQSNTPKTRDPRTINCPICHKRGRINDYHPDPTKPNTEYLVTHEKKRGTWGKNKSVRKRRRCYIKEEEHRNIILKRLGRSIEK